MNVAFEISKLRRLINTSGNLFEFKRYKKNAYGEATSEIEKAMQVNGLYHNTIEYITSSVSDGSIVHRKLRPMILCLKTAEIDDICQGDILIYNEKIYKVTGVINVIELNYAYNISLEVII